MSVYIRANISIWLIMLILMTDVDDTRTRNHWLIWIKILKHGLESLDVSLLFAEKIHDYCLMYKRMFLLTRCI